MSKITLRPATAADYDFLYQLYRTTLRAYIEQTWAWDEAWQQANFKDSFDPANRQIVVLDGADIGMISVRRRDGEIYLASIEILPDYQGQGIGTHLIRAVLDKAFAEQRPVTLKVLKVNPARRLYERLGFVAVEEARTHFVMRAMPEAG